MRKQEMLTLFEYMYWVNARLLDSAERLDNEVFTAPAPAAQRDLRGTLVHELDVEWSWRLSLQQRPSADWGPEAELKPDDFPDVGAVRRRWQEDEAKMRSWLNGLDDDQLDAEVHPGLADAPRPLWHFLMHVVLHAARQQSDAATLLTKANASPGDIEFGSFLSRR